MFVLRFMHRRRSDDNDDDQEDKTEKHRYLPVEIQNEILSRLPLKSLGRCKCVCKLWYSLVTKLARLQVKTSPRVYFYKEADEKTRIFHANVAGMVLEQVFSNGKFRIRNPFTNYKLNLPRLQRGCVFMSMFYLPETNDYKLVCTDYRNARYAGCQVLKLNTDSNWRDIGHFLDIGNFPESKLCSFRASGDLYGILCYSELVCLEIKHDRFVHVKIPQDVPLDYTAILLRWGEDQLALIHQREQEMHVWVLKNHRKGLWSERKIILLPMELFGDSPRASVDLYPHWYSKKNGWLFFLRRDYAFTGLDPAFVFYNVYTKKHKIVSSTRGKTLKFCVNPTILNCGKPSFEKNQGRRLELGDYVALGGVFLVCFVALVFKKP